MPKRGVSDSLAPNKSVQEIARIISTCIGVALSM